MQQVGIVGGSGYTGVELLRILLPHPQVGVAFVSSRANAGCRVDEVFPNLRGYTDLVFVDPDKAPVENCDLVFFATPNRTAMQSARAIIDSGTRVIDLSADFRIKDIAVWEQWYGADHACAELVEEAVYGLPEVHRQQIQSARLVANPGCYATAVQLGFLPLVESGGVDLTTLVADGKSGVSGAGRSASVPNLLAEAADSFKAYAVPGHRHLPEIEQGLSALCSEPLQLTFTPHLLPMIRGIHTTLYARMTREIDLQALFENRFAAEPFVDVMPPGAHPETRSVKGSNMLRLAVHQPQGRNMAVVLAVEDNLVKGAAGQAVQNMNLMLGLEETAGLGAIALLP